MRTALAALLLLAGCATVPVVDDRAAINTVIDDWHQAASVADESRYFEHMTTDAVFMGTDATERWDLAAFRAFAHPHFAKGTAWTFKPRGRNVMVHGEVAWFDEVLDSASYGECRGTGVLRREGGRWKIAHYNLTIPIPNDLAKEVVAKIRTQP
ncbi:MAG: nuclear transport factor 2 family protein [Thermoanaerobaculia bacterium]|nr:nuclear transport factor 2 family protein [Thermoanaerobaculia bacterium]